MSGAVSFSLPYAALTALSAFAVAGGCARGHQNDSVSTTHGDGPDESRPRDTEDGAGVSTPSAPPGSAPGSSAPARPPSPGPVDDLIIEDEPDADQPPLGAAIDGGDCVPQPEHPMRFAKGLPCDGSFCPDGNNLFSCCSGLTCNGICTASGRCSCAGGRAYQYPDGGCPSNAPCSTSGACRFGLPQP
jgi:hypothetical protein